MRACIARVLSDIDSGPVPSYVRESVERAAISKADQLERRLKIHPVGKRLWLLKNFRCEKLKNYLHPHQHFVELIIAEQNK
jgi:hypothetical protein